jgi:Protein tyrosine and serine/threonine kinase
MNNFRVVHLVVQNNARPERLSRIPDDLWGIIQLCWDQEPSKRPPMKEVIELMRKTNFGLNADILDGLEPAVTVDGLEPAAIVDGT